MACATSQVDKVPVEPLIRIAPTMSRSRATAGWCLSQRKTSSKAAYTLNGEMAPFRAKTFSRLSIANCRIIPLFKTFHIVKLPMDH